MTDWIQGELIGQGAFARVYLARNARTGGTFACKVAETAEGRTILAREAEIQRRITHPLFARYADFAEEHGRAMLVMEYVAGEGLADVLRREGAFSQERAARIAAMLAEGMKFLHEQPEPMLYRDLKPGNIRVQTDGAVRLLDLGCVCTVEEARHSRAGSRGYAPPEQLRDSPLEYGARPGFHSDVYALGKLLHYMLTGQNPCQPPFRKHPIRAYHPKLSPLLERLVEQCTEEDPAGRPPNMGVVMRRLEPFCKQERRAALWLRERAALLEWFCSGRRWEGDFVYEKSVVLGEPPRLMSADKSD